MFRQVNGASSDRGWLVVTIDGISISALGTETLAAVMLRAGMLHFRTTSATGQHRGPYCMMGVCFDCLVTINDQPNQQACLTLVRPGMRVERQTGDGSITGFVRGTQSAQ